jgi:hypothetical protein
MVESFEIVGFATIIKISKIVKFVKIVKIIIGKEMKIVKQ